MFLAAWGMIFAHLHIQPVRYCCDFTLELWSIVRPVAHFVSVAVALRQWWFLSCVVSPLQRAGWFHLFVSSAFIPRETKLVDKAIGRPSIMVVVLLLCTWILQHSLIFLERIFEQAVLNMWSAPDNVHSTLSECTYARGIRDITEHRLPLNLLSNPSLAAFNRL